MYSSTKKYSHRFHYAAALDPWLRQSHKEVEWLIKLSSITSKHIVVSDNQLINNQGLHRLLNRADVSNFLFKPDDNGVSPFVISLREGAKDFEDVLSDLILNREKPAIIPWMTQAQQRQLEASYYVRKKGKSLGPFFDIAGRGFQTYIERLNRFLEPKEASVIRWEGLQENYLALVELSIQRFIKAVEESSKEDEMQEVAIAVCEKMLDGIHRTKGMNRSNLFRIISDSPLSLAAKRDLELKLLYEPYHVNFALTGEFHAIMGPAYSKSNLDKILSDVAQEVQKLRPEDIIEIDEFPLYLHQIPFRRIQKIRNTYSFKQLVDAIAEAAPDARLNALRDLLNLISSELSKEPKGIRKLSRLRISVLLTPQRLQDHLQENGVSFGDLIAFASKAGGFLVGEVVGQLIGTFGIGGLVGTGAAVTVEQLSKQQIERPYRKREFQHVVQTLTAGQIN